MKVEVFVKSKEVPVIADSSSFASDHARCRGTVYKEELYVKYKPAKMLGENDMRLLEEAGEKAKELNGKVVVYDLSTLRGKLVAKLKGVKSPKWRIVE